ncbi:MAG: hypothetical protein V4772_24375 [Pseudomonadota bacterium]
MNVALKAAALAIAEHVKQHEAMRGEPLRATFKNPMANDALTTNCFGIPVPMLKALVAAVSNEGGAL